MLIDLSQLNGAQAYHTLSQTLIPRPIAWVLTENKVNANSPASYNLAPFSFFTPITGSPPIVMFSVGQKPGGGDKDTLVNIERSKKFTLHIANFDALPELNASSATLDYGVSEVEQNSLSLTEFESAPLPRLSGSPIALSCELVRIDEIGDTPQKLIFSQVKAVWVDDAAVASHSGAPFRLKINAEKINPLERLGSSEYARMGEVVKLARPD